MNGQKSWIDRSHFFIQRIRLQLFCDDKDSNAIELMVASVIPN